MRGQKQAYTFKKLIELQLGKSKEIYTEVHKKQTFKNNRQRIMKGVKSDSYTKEFLFRLSVTLSAEA